MSREQKEREQAEVEAQVRLIPRPALIEPTAEEKRNGWTAEKLTEYLHKRRVQQARFALNQKKNKVVRVENHFGFDPHRW